MLKRLSKLLKSAMAKFSISREGVLYTRYYKALSVDKGILLVDGFSDNPELLKELCNNPHYKALKKYIVVPDKAAAKLNKELTVVRSLSKRHLRLLASAGIVIGDCLPDFYIRRDKQTYINIASQHGSLSSRQRNYIISSYIICESEAQLNAVREKYMLSSIFSGSYIIGALCDALSYVQCTDDKATVISGDKYSQGRENVLIFTGALEKNGITSALKNLVNSVGDERSYIPFFYEKSVLPNKDSIKELGARDYISISGDMDMSLKETLVLGLYFLNFPLPSHAEKILDDIYNRELKRCFGDARIDYVIHFTGYARNVLQLICRLNAKRLVWVHNNMFLESETKGNVDIKTVKYGYDRCDKIVVVRDTMKGELEGYVEPEQRNKITVVHNLNDSRGILDKACRDIEFQEDTYCNVTVKRLNEILADDSIDKFINIARFSHEKGIDRLINAFDKHRLECDSSAYLIIIGGYGEEFENIKQMVLKRENIVLIKSINNPYPILKRCNAFVLSSHYEGLPMTIIEALILDVPVISTSITGPREFLEQGYGYLVDDSEQGLVDGFKAYKDNMLGSLSKFDVDKFNAIAMEEFQSLF